MTAVVTRTYEWWRQQLDGVPALTLRNPWAHYIAHYGKDIENRTWLPTGTLTWLLIHAGLGWDRVPDHLVPRGDVGDPHTGAIVALVNVVRFCDRSRRSDRLLCGCGRWAQPGQVHWQFAGVWPLTVPVRVDRGRLGLWYPGDIAVHDVASALVGSSLSTFNHDLGGR